MSGVLNRGNRPSVLVAGVVAVVLTAGPVVNAPAAEPPAAEPLCLEPDPCDYVWEGAELGSFELADVQPAEVRSHDGTVLRGWIALPDLPPGMTAPVALHSSPYVAACVLLAVPAEGGCLPGPEDAAFWDDEPSAGAIRAWGVPPIELIRNGYVAAFFDVRGTGRSEGCIDWGGRDETEDQVALVDWVAAQPWSNGRVAMGGNSYPAATAWQAAIQAPEALKTIVTAGIVTDWYTFFHTPQGMHHTQYVDPGLHMDGSTAWLPHLGKGAAAGEDIAHLGARAQACDPFPTVTEPSSGGFLRERDSEFWEPRRYQDRLNQVTAGVLMAHGLRDVTGHAFQDMLVWEALHGARPPGQRPPHLPCPPQAPFCAAAPKSPPTWQVSGQWGHGPPFAAHPELPPERWREILFDWLGYWLQGVGDAPPHRVDYQDTAGAWHTSSAWPPAEARQEALYLGGDQLSPDPADGDRWFRAAPSPGNDHATWMEHGGGGSTPAWSWCSQGTAGDLPGTAVAYMSEPFTTDSLLAGNPFAYLELSSDQPGGQLEVSLVRWPAGASCTDLVESGNLVTRGGVDLRHHEGGYEPRPFPVDSPIGVRVDLFNAAVRFAPGDRLVAVLSGSEAAGVYTSVSAYQPAVKVHAGISHLVVPFVEGGLGGGPSGIDYPANPAAPVSAGGGPGRGTVPTAPR